MSPTNGPVLYYEIWPLSSTVEESRLVRIWREVGQNSKPTEVSEQETPLFSCPTHTDLESILPNIWRDCVDLRDLHFYILPVNKSVDSLNLLLPSLVPTAGVMAVTKF